jgi:hypothetical protein
MMSEKKGFGALAAFLFLIVLAFAIVFLMTRSAGYGAVGAIAVVMFLYLLMYRLRIV